MLEKVDIRVLVDRLNRCCRMALEEAASLCVTQGHREVTVSHLLVCLLKQPSIDMRVIAQSAGVDADAILEKVESSFNRFSQARVDRVPAFSHMLMELLQDAWLVASLELKQPQVRSGLILIAILRDLGRYAEYEYYTLLQRLSPDAILRDFTELTQGSVEEQGGGAGGKSFANAAGRKGEDAESALARYGQNFTDLAREGKIDPVFCRDNEIRQISEILCRRRKNNPICVGEAGVGKTAVAEGMALRIINNEVPDALKGVELWGLDLGALQAGASIKGEFEKRLKAVIEEVRSAAKPIILFIDEAHTLIGAGNQQGGGGCGQPSQTRPRAW